MENIIIFASGSGTNAKNIIEYFKQKGNIRVAAIFCNKPQAGVVDIAKNENIPCIIIEKEAFFRGHSYLPEIKKYNPVLIVLAGFLWIIPPAIIQEYRGSIINIHPALLPKYGGKGFYGKFVHEAVIAAGEKESGITIHYVDEVYDHGDAIFQAKCEVLAEDTPDTLAARIHRLEYAHFPVVIEKLVSQKIQKSA